MAYERKTNTPEELKALRQANMQKAIAARKEKARLRNTPACHPDRPMYGRTGLCHECFVGGTATKEITPEQAVKMAEKLGASKDDVDALKKEALALLIQRLPDYARAHFEAAKAAAMKGDAKPAEWALQNIKEAGGTAVVEPPTKTPAEGGVKILIGVNLGGLPAPDSASNLVSGRISESAVGRTTQPAIAVVEDRVCPNTD